MSFKSIISNDINICNDKHVKSTKIYKIGQLIFRGRVSDFSIDFMSPSCQISKPADISLTATDSIFALTMTSKMSFNDASNTDDVVGNLFLH